MVRILTVAAVSLPILSVLAVPSPDMNGSFSIDLADWALFQVTYGWSGAPGGSPGDFNLDGFVGPADQQIFVNTVCGPAVADNCNPPDCEDGKPCTLGVCACGHCDQIDIPGCCDNDLDCADEWNCTLDRCQPGIAFGCTNVPNNMFCNPTALEDRIDPDGDCYWKVCIPEFSFYGLLSDANGCFAYLEHEKSGSTCDDGISCTTNDACEFWYGCVGVPNHEFCMTPRCDDPDSDCRTSMCVPTRGGCATVNPYSLREGAGSPCSQTGWTGHCSAAGGCIYEYPPAGWCGSAADAGQPDHSFLQNIAPGPMIAAAHLSQYGGPCEPVGSPCDDGIECTVNDRCTSNLGCRGTPNAQPCNITPRCDDPDDDCHWAACAPDYPESDARGCVAHGSVEDNGSPCDDGIACTANDFCVFDGLFSYCYGTPQDELCNAAPQCDDPDADCLWSSCEPENPEADSRGCVVDGAAELGGSPCNDGFACTVRDSCSEPGISGLPGSCRGTPDNQLCNDAPFHADPDADCRWALCFPYPYCISPPNSPPLCPDANGCIAEDQLLGGEAWGSGCDDGNPCTIDDSCVFGQCVGKATDACVDVAVALFRGGPTWLPGENSAALDDLAALLRLVGSGRVVTNVISESDSVQPQLNEAALWFNDPELIRPGCEPPRRLLVGHSWGGDTVANSGILGEAYRVTLDPISRAMILSAQPECAICRFYQRLCMCAQTLPTGCLVNTPVDLNLLAADLSLEARANCFFSATTCLPSCLRGYEIQGAERHEVTGTDHNSIVIAAWPFLRDLVVNWLASAPCSENVVP